MKIEAESRLLTLGRPQPMEKPRPISAPDRNQRHTFHNLEAQLAIIETLDPQFAFRSEKSEFDKGGS